MQTNLWIYTNDVDEVVTQTSEHIEAQVIHWSGTWGASTSPVFTIEYCDDLLAGFWAPFVPTSQWPIAENYWSNSTLNVVSMRFFRVHANVIPGH